MRGSGRAAGDRVEGTRLSYSHSVRGDNTRKGTTHDSIILKCDIDCKKKSIEELSYEKDKKWA